MSKSTIKMIGLAMMMLSVFAILFGAHATQAGAPEPTGIALVLAGLAILLAGLILYAVIDKD